MQRVEHHIRPKSGEHLRDIAIHVDTAHLMAVFLQRIGHTIAAAQRYFALGGPAAHQDRDVEAFFLFGGHD